MRKLDLKTTSEVIGGGQCTRLARRVERANRQRRLDTRDRLMTKYKALC